MTEPLIDLGQLGWDDGWEAEAAAYGFMGAAGRVTRVDRGLCSLVTSAGPRRASLGADVMESMLSNSLAAPCTGDWCLLREWPDGPTTLDVVLPRRTAVSRAEASGTSRGQMLAANVDIAAVVVSLHPEPHLGRIERLVSLAWSSGAQPLIILTKADAVDDADLIAEDVHDATPDVDVLCTSVVTGAGVERLRQLLGGRATLALLGASGHGKSSLSNALVGTDVLRTERIRPDGRGRHTSVRRELLMLPGGGAVIDTPGLRAVGVTDMTAGIDSTFTDIAALSQLCRFSDCTHSQEPGCGVLAAVDRGLLSVRRLASWAALRREQQRLALRTDARLRAQQGKRLSKRQRAERRPKDGA